MERVKVESDRLVVTGTGINFTVRLDATSERRIIHLVANGRSADGTSDRLNFGGITPGMAENAAISSLQTASLEHVDEGESTLLNHVMPLVMWGRFALNGINIVTKAEGVKLLRSTACIQVKKGNGGGNTGWARSMMQSYLMENGLPIYANNSGYQGDKTYEAVATNRDPRLTYNTLLPGDLLSEGGSNIEYLVKGYGYYYRAPIVLGQDENKCPTGYSVKKGLATDAAQGPTLPSTTACVIFRAAEAYLNYMEADYELNNSLDANSSKYWKALRNRAGMDTDFQKTIDATDLSKEIDFARYSGSEFVSTTLYNIRRERRIEFAAEGLRLNDLKRWRALDMMQGYHVEGFDLWSENYQRYKTPSPIPVADVTLSVINLIESGNNNANVSAKSESRYLRPYRINTNNIAYNGYNWNQNKYLNPIAFDHFRLTTAEEGSTDYTTSTIYQNPGWKIETSSLPEGD